MKKIFYVLCAAAMLCSCGSKGYVVKGTLTEAGDSVFLLAADRAQSLIAGGAVDASGHFRIEGESDAPSIALLVTEDYRSLTPVFIEKGTITVTQTGDRIDIGGTPANDAFRAFVEEMDGLREEFLLLDDPESAEAAAIEERVEATMKAALDANTSNLFGLYMLANTCVEMESAEVRNYLESFPEAVRQSDLAQEIAQMLAERSASEVGEPYMELTLNDTKGQPVALSSVVGAGKWVLVDFWATWCGPCKKEIPYLVEAYKSYRDKGFEIYGVSLDRDLEAWKAYVGDAANGMSWINVAGEEDDAAHEQSAQYGVRSIPSNFLISPDGRIVARNLRGEEVLEKLAELLP